MDKDIIIQILNSTCRLNIVDYDEAQTLDSLGIDSLAMLELAFVIEERFNIKVDNEGLINIRTLGDIFEFIENRTTK